MTGTDVRAGSCRYLLNQQTLSIEDETENNSEDVKIVQKTLRAAKKRFGGSYSNEDLMFLSLIHI